MGRLGAHAHVVSVFDLGETPSTDSAAPQPYIVTELMAGGDVEGRYPYAGGAGQSADPTADSTASRDSSPVKDGLVKLTDPTFARNHGKTMKAAAGLRRLTRVIY